MGENNRIEEHIIDNAKEQFRRLTGHSPTCTINYLFGYLIDNLSMRIDRDSISGDIRDPDEDTVIPLKEHHDKREHLNNQIDRLLTIIENLSGVVR
jgi:MoaA/NifB/PqqE/SkfB family radical SAM enzyme